VKPGVDRSIRITTAKRLNHSFRVESPCLFADSFRMSTYTQLLYHVVFATKGRQRVLQEDRRDQLFKYIWGIVKNLDSVLYRIGGVEDHVHILVGLHPTISVADFVKTLKVASSKWIKEEAIFPQFTGWQDGYAALTCSLAERDSIIAYIKNQVEHHRAKEFLEEYREFLERAGIKLDERFLP
jgi:putative transposase